MERQEIAKEDLLLLIMDLIVDSEGYFKREMD